MKQRKNKDKRIKAAKERKKKEGKTKATNERNKETKIEATKE